MLGRLALLTGVCAVGIGVGCASILSIPDRSPDWCDQPGNTHDFCEDFDHGDASGAWGTELLPGTSLDFVPSTQSPPNAAKLSVAAQPFDAGTVAGMLRQFPNEKFDHVRLSADVKFDEMDLRTVDGLGAALGFMLIEETNFCIGVVMTPNGLGLVMRAHTTDCTTVRSLPVDAGALVDDAGLAAFAPAGPKLPTNAWFRISLDVKRNSDGSGVVGFDIEYPGAITPPRIPAGVLTEGLPAVAIATSVAGPTGRIAVEFDNVTVDFSSN